jgi:hypothetical protein
LDNLNPASVSTVSSNIAGEYSRGRYQVNGLPRWTAAILVTTVLAQPLASECLIAGKTLALTCHVERLAGSKYQHNEFVFVVDCSNSMEGARIRDAANCLKIFLASLPETAMFNVVRFGSTFEPLFECSIPYREKAKAAAFTLANNMKADLRSTKLLEPLKFIFGQPVYGGGLRQIFVMTDGQVGNTDSLINLARKNRDKNRIFTLGIGRAADAGVINGLARVTCGRADFLASSDDMTPVVISQLETSLQVTFEFPVIKVPDNDSIEVAPLPMSPITQSVSATYFMSSARVIEQIEAVFVDGEFAGSPMTLTAKARPTRLDPCLMHGMYAYEALRCMEPQLKQQTAQQEFTRKYLDMSITSGVLCKRTAFVAVFDEKPEPETYITIEAEGERLLISVPENCRVETLRERVQRKLGISKICMVQRRKVLEDSMLISSYRIRQTSTVCLQCPLMGGGGGPAYPTPDSKSILLGLVEI